MALLPRKTVLTKFLLDDLKNLLLIEFLGETLNSGQSLTTIALLNPNMDVILRLLGLASVFVGLGEGVYHHIAVSFISQNARNDKIRVSFARS